MKRLLVLLALVAVVFNFVGCSMVPPGNVGVKVYLLGGRKGVTQEILGVGRYHIGINEKLYLFPTFTQNYVWTQSVQEGSPTDESITFQTKEGLSVNGDFGISYRIEPTKVADVFQKYRRGVEEITDIFLRNMVRDAISSNASKMSVEAIYGEGKQELLNKTQADVAAQCAPIGIVIEKLYIINELRLPQTVVNSINAKIQATQQAIQAENEIRKAQAEAKIKIAQAEGEAKANYLRASSITQNLIEWRKMEIRMLEIAKWNGAYPQVLTGQGSNFLFDVGGRK